MKRVLAIFPGALGDLFLFVPAAVALARRDCRVELSVLRPLVELARHFAPLGPPADGRAMSTLFGADLDPAVADWLRGADAVHAWLGRDADRTLARHVAALGVGTLRTHAVERGDGPRHASACYADALGVEGPLAAPCLSVAAAVGVDWWRGPRSRRLLLHPGAGAVEKRWAREGFRQVAEAWRVRGGDVGILLGPAEEDEHGFWRAAGERVAARTSVMDAAALIAGAGRYLGNDSGVSHLAGALGLSGAVLFGPTRPQRWRPLGGTLVPIEFSAACESVVVRMLLEALGCG